VKSMTFNVPLIGGVVQRKSCYVLPIDWYQRNLHRFKHIWRQYDASGISFLYKLQYRRKAVCSSTKMPFTINLSQRILHRLQHKRSEQYDVSGITLFWKSRY
jgi:hypothetical protein